MRIPRSLKITGLVVLCILVLGFLLPESATIPVSGASRQDWNQDTFWYEPWGRSGVHKGIDIFAPSGTPVVSATYGIVLYTGTLKYGGNVVVILGPKWRLHYYAHLQHIDVATGAYVSRADDIGRVGDTGNAQGKQPHLHYAIVTFVPYPWRWDSSTQGWKKIFFLNPGDILPVK